MPAENPDKNSQVTSMLSKKYQKIPPINITGIKMERKNMETQSIPLTESINSIIPPITADTAIDAPIIKRHPASHRGIATLEYTVLNRIFENIIKNVTKQHPESLFNYLALEVVEVVAVDCLRIYKGRSPSLLHRDSRSYIHNDS